MILFFFFFFTNNGTFDVERIKCTVKLGHVKVISTKTQNWIVTVVQASTAIMHHHRVTNTSLPQMPGGGGVSLPFPAQSPSHKHKAVHSSPSFAHEHFLPHPLRHAHFMSSRQTSEADGRWLQ